MRGWRVRLGAVLLAVVTGCGAWLLVAGAGSSVAASAGRLHRRTASAPGVVLGRPAFRATRREARLSERRVPRSRHWRVPARAGAKLAWRSRANSNTYQAGSGRLQTRIYPYAVNYRSAKGRFVPIDAGLVASSGGYRQRANDLGLRLPGAASGSAHLSIPAGGLSVRLLGAAGHGVARGTAERFFDALPGVDFGYVSQNTGLGWQAQMSPDRAERGLSWLVSGSEGLSPKLVAGGVAFRTRRGRTVWTFQAPTVRQQGSGRPVPVRLSLHRTARGLVIHVASRSAARPHASFGVLDLSDSSAQLVPAATAPGGPLVWDGQVVAGQYVYDGVNATYQQTGDCYIDSGSPNTSLCGASTNLVGPDDHTLVNFDLQDSLPSHVQVLQAFLAMTISSASGGSSENIGVWQANQAWTNSATWNTYDGSTAWTTPGGDTTGAMQDDTSPIGASSVNTTQYWDVPTSAQAWIDDNPQQDDGFLFAPTNGTSATETLGFDTSSSSSSQPYLAVYYEPRMGDYPGAKYDSQSLTNRSSLGVNVATGNLLVSNDDLDLAGVNGLSLDVGRYYNNLSSDQDAFGLGWSMSNGADTYLSIPSDGDNTVDYMDGSGNAQMFTTGPTGSTEIAPPGVDAQLTINSVGSTYASSTFTLLFRHSGITETFTAPANALNKVARLTSIADRNGNTIHYAYNSSNQLTTITDSYGHATTITWSPEGYISQITDPTGRTYKYVQNTSGQLTQYEDPAGNTTNYTYDSYGNLTQIKSPAGRITNVTYDAGNTNEVESVQRLVHATDSSGPTWTYQIAPASGTCTANAGWTQDTVDDPDRHVTTFCTDDLSRITSAVDAAGHAQSTTYNADGYVASTTDQLGTPTTFSYSNDGDDNVTAIQDGATGGGGSGSSAYSGPETTSFSYSGTSGSANQYLPSSTQDASGNATSYSYGTGASGSYGAGEPTTITDGLSSQNTVHLTYNANGTIATSTDANGNQTTYSYTSGNLTTVTPPSGSGLNAIHLTYDSANRVSTVSSVSGTTGHKVAYAYNALDQETQAVYTNPAGATVETVNYTYDPDGNLTQVSDVVGSTTNSYNYTYDGLNRLTSQTLADGVTANYFYDPAGNITDLNGPNGDTNYTYNALNQATEIYDPGQSKPLATFTYDADGHLLNTTYSTGASDDDSYNLLGELVKTTDTYKTSSGTIAHLSYAYTYTPGGLQHTLTDQAGNVTTYSYDALERLTQAQTQNAGATTAQYQYSYDGNGNLLKQITSGSAVTGSTTSYAYNPGNETCWSYSGTSSNACGSMPSGGHAFSYDADGNELSNGNGLSMTYNALQQTTSITSSGATTNYSYIGEGQAGLASEGTNSLDAEPYGIGAITNSSSSMYYTRAPSGRLLDEQTPGGTYDYLYDGSGNVVGLTNSAGQLVKQYAYGPYGTTTMNSGAIANPFGYRAGYQAVSGLYHFGQRFVNPTQGIWTQEDPLDQVSSLSQDDRYAYAGDDPINALDLAGLESLDQANSEAEGSCAEGAVTGFAASGFDPVGAAAGCASGEAVNYAAYGASKISSGAGVVVHAVGETADEFKDAYDFADNLF